MKNIQVLPTDKPSNLLLCIKDYLEHKDTPAENSDTKGNFRLGLGIYANTEVYQYQNIYITSDEEIKEGDWCLLDHNVGQSTGYSILKCLESDVENGEYTFKDKDGDIFTTGRCKKIILTTDQELIKDGVQPIDDEFLEWFVKNPSCEEVEINSVIILKESRDETDYPEFDYYNYEIIIPKEETYVEKGLDYSIDLKEPKQETFVNKKCFKCGRSQYSSRKPFCTDDFCNKDFFQKSKQKTPQKQEPIPELTDLIMMVSMDGKNWKRRNVIALSKGIYVTSAGIKTCAHTDEEFASIDYWKFAKYI